MTVMHRRVASGTLPLACLALLSAFGCGGAGQQSTSTMAPVDPTIRSGGGGGTGSKADAGFKPTVGLNSPLGTLRALSEKHPLAKAADGKAATGGAEKLAKLDKAELKLDDAYGYIVADATAPRTTAGEKGASVPLPAEAKTNPDGSVWVVDSDTRRLYTLSGVKREADKPATVAEALSSDLVRPSVDGIAPALGLVVRAEEATTEIKHALRIVVKGVGGEGAPEAGSRIRLKKGVADKGVPPLAKGLLRALKKYGAVLAPGDGAPALSALADPRWTKEDAKAIAVLHLSDFELIAPAAKPVKVTKPKA